MDTVQTPAVRTGRGHVTDVTDVSAKLPIAAAQ